MMDGAAGTFPPLVFVDLIESGRGIAIPLYGAEF